jgi:hypothetical protein
MLLPIKIVRRYEYVTDRTAVAFRFADKEGTWQEDHASWHASLRHHSSSSSLSSMKNAIVFSSNLKIKKTTNTVRLVDRESIRRFSSFHRVSPTSTDKQNKLLVLT